MTVNQLIEELKKFPPDHKVYFIEEGYCEAEIDTVETKMLTHDMSSSSDNMDSFTDYEEVVVLG